MKFKAIINLIQLRKRLCIANKPWRSLLVQSFLLAGFLIIIRLLCIIQFVEFLALDEGLKLRPAEPMDERIVIVGINEEDIRRVGVYPIPDETIAQLLQTLQQYQPSIIGLDLFRDLPVQPGHENLVQQLKASGNVIGIDRILPDQSGFTTNPPPSLPREKIGFSDVLLDEDGNLRRSLLATSNPQGEFHFSLAVRLAETYLATYGVTLENGLRDRDALMFGSKELERFQSNTGGYIGADAAGNQILLNPRSGQKPFRILSLSQLQSGQVKPDWLKGKIVLVGLTALSVKDVVNVNAIQSNHLGVVNGVEVQAHFVSQIISHVLDDRALLRSWSEPIEYLWIFSWILLALYLYRLLKSPWSALGITFGLEVLLVGLSHILLCLGWWIPLIPPAIGVLLMGVAWSGALFRRYEQDLREKLNDRQFIIEHTFNAIHNGPLQTLATIMRLVQSQDLNQEILFQDLNNLNQELRTVYESVRRETLDQQQSLYLSNEYNLDLEEPLHEILYKVYLNTLARDFPYFQTIKVRVITFEPIDDRHLTIEEKRYLCRFLEEALCNAGKYAIGMTKLSVICQQERGQGIVQVIDNGQGLLELEQLDRSGLGTRQAEQLAKQLRGQFKRIPHATKGVCCELRWRI